jgi:hypothetical protein
MDSLLKKMVYNVVKCSQPTTKKEVKSNVYDLALKTGLLTKDLVLAFGDIGWVLQNLRQVDNVLKVTKVGSKHFWETV